jgi:hypothetical protein
MVVFAKHSQAAATQDTSLDAGDHVVRGGLKELGKPAPADQAADLVVLRKSRKNPKGGVR